MRIRAVIAALPLLALVACGSSSSSTSTPATTTNASSGVAASSGAATGSASSSAAPDLGPSVPPATVLAPAVAAALMPTATGKFGTKPTLTFPKTTPPPSLQRSILSRGTGALTKKGDFLVTNYLGQVWGGKVFDNSYDRKATSSFQIADNKVVPGWVVALAGVPVGSRVLLSLPPADGYGSTGNSGAGIKATDTIVFVVDIVGDIADDAGGQANAVLQPAVKNLPTVTGALGKEPKITVPKGLTEPTTNSTYLIAKGTGAKLKAGSVLAQLVVTDWTQTQTQSTWIKAGAAPSATTGLQQLTIDTTGTLKGLIGLPLGSRVLLLIAASTDSSTGQSQPGEVAVLDLVAQG